MERRWMKTPVRLRQPSAISHQVAPAQTVPLDEPEGSGWLSSGSSGSISQRHSRFDHNVLPCSSQRGRICPSGTGMAAASILVIGPVLWYVDLLEGDDIWLLLAQPTKQSSLPRGDPVDVPSTDSHKSAHRLPSDRPFIIAKAGLTVGPVVSEYRSVNRNS